VCIERQRVYRNHARVATRFRDGRVFLLGDAAHLMPPFAGQGLASGLRDAINLVWKLDAVLRGRLPTSVLDTYERERRLHAEESVTSSLRMGRLFFPRSRWAERVRDAGVSLAFRIQSVRDAVEQGRLAKARRVSPDGFFHGRAPAGMLLPQPKVTMHDGGAVRLDSALGDDFAIIGIGADPATRIGASARSRLQALGLRSIAFGEARHPVDKSGRMAAWFGEHKGSIAVVRPDRIVAAFGEGADIDTAVERLLG